MRGTSLKARQVSRYLFDFEQCDIGFSLT